MPRAPRPGGGSGWVSYCCTAERWPAGLVAAEVLGRLPGFPWWWAVSWACVLAVPLTETRWLDRAVRVNDDVRVPAGVR